MLRIASTLRASARVNGRFTGAVRFVSSDDGGSHSDFAPKRKAPATSDGDEVATMLQEVSVHSHNVSCCPRSACPAL